MAKARWQWWNCLLCEFRMHDDFSVEAAERMGEHIAVHEQEEQTQKSLVMEKAERQPGALDR
jgi:hypothetical protein